MKSPSLFFRKTLLACRYRDKGFSLIEMSIVLVIAGLLLTVAISISKSLTQSTKFTKEKGNITAIKNSLVAYALNRGRLPCPDINSDGKEDCPVSSCTNPPCNLPYIDINLSNATRDTWTLPYHYDVTNILTTTNSSSLCLTLYQLNNLYSWYGSPAGATCGASNLVCATTTADGNNGAIDSSGTGYYLAAYIISRGEDRILGAKNAADTRREYEMASNAYDIASRRDDLVGELSFADIADKACNAQNTFIEVTISAGEVWMNNSGGCVAGTGLSGTVMMSQGQRMYYLTGCTKNITFEELARCDVNPAAYSGTHSCVAGTAMNAKVSVNASANPAVITQ